MCNFDEDDVPGEVFQSTRPLGGAMYQQSEIQVQCPVSIHAPPGGRDVSGKNGKISQAGFNPRAPWGARFPSPKSSLIAIICFNPRAPWGARCRQQGLYDRQ